MTGKERMIKAMRRQMPDRVPACPDISNLVPAKLTGKPFWQIYYYNDPPLGEAYLNAVDLLGMDAWYIYDELRGGNALWADEKGPMYSLAPSCSMIPDHMVKRTTLSQTEERLAVHFEIPTPYGSLTKEEVYPSDNAPWQEHKWLKDIDRDWKALQYIMGDSWKWSTDLPNYDRLGDRGIYSLMLLLPLDWWYNMRDGGDEQLAFDLTDRPEQMKEIFQFYTEVSKAQVRAYAKAGAEEVHLQGSVSSLSLSSPLHYTEYNLPWLKEITALCKELGIISHQHTCGRSRLLVDINMAETCLDVMEPLEPPPSGDVDLAEVKKKYGDRLALKGNLNTFNLMLHGTPEEVEEAAKKAIDAAAEGGGFVLSTGDQCGRDTPLENLRKLVEVAETYGRY